MVHSCVLEAFQQLYECIQVETKTLYEVPVDHSEVSCNFRRFFFLISHLFDQLNVKFYVTIGCGIVYNFSNKDLFQPVPKLQNHITRVC